MTFKELKDLLNSIEDDKILDDFIQTNAFFTRRNEHDLLNLEIELEGETLFVNINDCEVGGSDLLAIVPIDYTILDSKGEEMRKQGKTPL